MRESAHGPVEERNAVGSATTAGAKGPAARRRFGERLVDRGLASSEQIARALKVQAERAGRGVQQNLGEILVEQGVLTTSQVRALLEDQDQIIMVCPSCGERYNVRRSACDRAACPADGSGLALLDGSAEQIGVVATLSPATTPDEAPIGLEIGRCRIVEFLGRGGMGAVYKARHLPLNRYVALKMIPSASQDQTFIKRLVVEAQTVARLEHPNIVQVYDVGYEKGYFFMVMQFLRGATLARRLEEFGRPPLPEALEIIRDVALGLEAAHAQGVIHRDIKPSNIFVSDDGRARLMDFGLSLMTESRDDFGGLVVGTPGYMSPEQYQGRPVDARSDIYSLGVVFYLLLTGVRPFGGNSPSEVRDAQLMAKPKAPRVINSDVTEGIQAVVAKMMSRVPQRRYPSVSSLLEDLGRLIRGEDPQAAVETGRFVKCGFCESLNPGRAARCRVCGEPLRSGPEMDIDFGVRPGEFLCLGCGAPNPKGARACRGCHRLFCPVCGERPLREGVRCPCGGKSR